jgi:chitodextrinase
MPSHLAVTKRLVLPLALPVIALTLSLLVIAGAASAAPTGNSPTNLTPPIVTGAPVVGSKLTATTGTWTGRISSVYLSWSRCSSTGTSCQTVVGGASTYTPTSADVGSTLVAVATARNKWGSSTSAASAPTAVVAPSATAPPAPPTAPSDLHVMSTTTTAIDVAWSASTAPAGLAGYGLYRDGSLVATTGSTSATFGGLTCGTSPNLAVDAYDTLGNRSAKSAVAASTSACAPPADTEAPTAPANVHTTGTTTTSLTIAWNPSTDNVGVTGYGVYRNSASVSVVAATTITLGGLTCGTTYSVAVDATDAAGNRSAKTTVSAATSACPVASTSPTGIMTGAHWGDASDLSTFKQIGYGFDVTTCNPGSLSGCTSMLDTARSNGLKLIIGGYEPYWVKHYTAAQLRALRTKIRSVWPQAPVYQDLGQPSCWVTGGGCQGSGPQYDDQSGVCDYCGIWDYPFTTSGYTKTQSLAIASKETAFVQNNMHGIPVWLNQSHAASCCSLVMPTQSQIKDWNCAVRQVLPTGSLISWYVWRQGIYGDMLANHPEDWSSTTATACAL